MFAPHIYTSRFALRPLTPDDASQRYSHWLDDEQARRFIVAARAPHDLAALRAYIAERCARRDVLFLGIFLRTDGTHIGTIKFEPVDESGGYAVMGILIGDPSWRGKGVTREVIEASAAWLAEHRGIREVVLGVGRDHSAAIHAYEKAGFRVEATQRITLDLSSQIAMVRRVPVSGPVLLDD
jgi:RimJ/RimL family protein N-acetyltransferase